MVMNVMNRLRLYDLLVISVSAPLEDLEHEVSRVISAVIVPLEVAVGLGLDGNVKWYANRALNWSEYNARPNNE